MNTVTFIILMILILIMGAGLISFIQRVKGEKSCCGTEADKVKPKKLEHPMGSFTVKIEGMRCESCKRIVMAKLNELEGVSAKVSLEHKRAIITYERPVADEEIIKAVKSVGYEVTEICPK